MIMQFIFYYYKCHECMSFAQLHEPNHLHTGEYAAHANLQTQYAHVLAQLNEPNENVYK